MASPEQAETGEVQYRRGQRKLTDEQVARMRKLAAGKMAQKDLCRIFGLSQPQVSLILSGKRR